ncbi:MAG: hypothetical protein WA865_14360 [Spirulinaceae cyanobacterium]
MEVVDSRWFDRLWLGSEMLRFSCGIIFLLVQLQRNLRSPG